MGLGHEIIREQRFFRMELRERVFWFIRLRWAAVGLAGAGLVWARAAGLPVPMAVLAGVTAFMALYNLGFLAAAARLEPGPAARTRPYETFAHVQIGFDLLTLFLFIHFTGGLTSPLLFFCTFHVILAGILLSPASCYVYAAVIIAVAALLFGLHRLGLGAWPGPGLVNGGALPLLPLNRLMLHGLLFAAGILITAYLTVSIKTALRHKGRELMAVSRDLEITNTRLTALYGMIRESLESPDLARLMDNAVGQAARIMGVTACSIKLLDANRQTLRYTAARGLSNDYLSKGPIRVDRSPINRRVLEGSQSAVGKVVEEDAFERPEDLKREGIASMLCLPLKAQARILGVFCVYSNEPDYFQQEDVAFFSLVTDLTALAMARLQHEENKTWFLHKAAHQLRAPVGTVQSMLGTLAQGYAGELPPDAASVVVRSRERLRLLQETVNDLLTLARGREAGTEVLAAIPAAEVLEQVAAPFAVQAAEKGVTLSVRVEPDLPPARGTRGRLDDLFSNLISNAVKYTPTGGRVDVSLSRSESGGLVFDVADTGMGLSEEDQRRLFTEFFRSEAARAGTEEGTGLGLAIVKETLEFLGGRITVAGNPGAGARFTCLLPSA